MTNTEQYNYKIDQNSRNNLNKHKSFVIWFTGLSGSGKSTICNSFEKLLYTKKVNTFTLDGDNVRNGLNKDLSFSNEDRSENIRRIAEVSKILMNAGNVVLASFITPFQKDRDLVKDIVGENNYIEVFLNTSLKTCIERDPKGLYQKSKSGLIKNMTGIDSKYEIPKSYDIEISEHNTIEESVEILYGLIKDKLAITNE
ncbi:MAG: adenylyl-sulfate kinase [Flavobacteriaceae bacterium]|nr:adenylyl-sulfate kinase [Flavobacteriaceae bacterium]